MQGLMDFFIYFFFAVVRKRLRSAADGSEKVDGGWRREAVAPHLLRSSASATQRDMWVFF